MKLHFHYFIFSLVIFSFSCEEETPNPQTEQNCFEVNENFNDSPTLESTWQFLGFVNNLTGEEVCFPAGMVMI
ncbi:MAG: hypothetical protein ACOC0C_05015 [Bacteroidota bacterium]